jgi:hypothetical protein
LHASIDASLPLAINIKADGLHKALVEAVERHGLVDYFLFDHSVPDLRVSLQHGLKCFTRQSEVEMAPAFFTECAGVWVDTFEHEWIAQEHLQKVIGEGKVAALVSPELHHRPHLGFWQSLATWGLAGEKDVMLCTDLPEEARKFFSNT